MSETLGNINKVCENKSNAPGLKQFLYVANAADIESIPEPSTNLTVTDDIVMKPGKTFKRWAISKNEQGWDSKRVGDEDGKVSETEAKVYIPELSSYKSEILSCNDMCAKIVITVDNNGKQRIVGLLGNEAYTSADEQAAPKNGYVVTAKATTARPPYYYTGAIAVEPDAEPPTNN